MDKLPTLHVFGSSTIFNFSEENGIGDSKLSWPYLLSAELGYSLNTYGKAAVCNSFIGRQIIQNLDKWGFPNKMGLIEISNMNKWYISKTDQHFSIEGHKQIAKLLKNEVKNTIKL